jgi:hypothetical protein
VVERYTAELLAAAGMPVESTADRSAVSTENGDVIPGSQQTD